MTVLRGIFPGMEPVNETIEAMKEAETQRHAVLYIVIVLLFYSVGIIIAMISYLKREKAEMEETNAYEEYMNYRADPGRWHRDFQKKLIVAKLDEFKKDKDALSAIEEDCNSDSLLDDCQESEGENDDEEPQSQDSDEIKSETVVIEHHKGSNSETREDIGNCSSSVT